MKRAYLLLFTLVSLYVLTSCQKESLFSNNAMDGIEMDASMEQQIESATKTSISGVTVSWSSGDAVRVYNSDGTAYTDLVTESGDGHFTGGSLTGTPSVVMYPSDFCNGYSDGKISFTLPQIQNYAENSFGPNSNASVATFADNTTFYNVCGVLKLKLKADFVVSKIELTSEDKLWGNFKTTVNTEPAMEIDGAATEAEKTIVLMCGDGVKLCRTAETSFCFVVPKGALSNGFTAKVYEKNNDNVYNYSICETAKDNTISRSKVLAMPGISILPAGFMRTNYLESTGEQYYYTGLLTSDYTSSEISGTITEETIEDGKAYLFKGKSGQISDAVFKNGDEIVAHFIPCLDMNTCTEEIIDNNLFDKNTMVVNRYVETNGAVGTANGYSIVMPCEPSTRYLFSRTDASLRYRVACFSSYPDKGKTGVVCPAVSVENITRHSFKTTSDASYLMIWFMNATETGSYATNAEFLESQKNQIAVKKVKETFLATMVDIESHSRNLFNYMMLTQGYVESNGRFYTSMEGARSIILPCKPSTAYTFSRNTSCYRFRVGCTSSYPENNTQGKLVSGLPGADDNVTSFTCTTTSDASYLVIWFMNSKYSPNYSSWEEMLDNQIKQIQVEEGSEKTAYQPGYIMWNQGSGAFLYN